MANGRLGKYEVKGYGQSNKKKNIPSPLSDANRLPSVMLIDASGSMAPYADTLKGAAKQMIETCAMDPTAKNRIDLEVLTFNSNINTYENIAFEELYKMVEKSNQIKSQYEDMIQFTCAGLTPTAYALKEALDDIMGRVDLLKQAGKSPMMPVMFVLSDGLPEVPDAKKQEHDKLLSECLTRIKGLVNKNELAVIAVEIGMICEEPKTPIEQRYHAEMHKLMQDITGLNDKRHVCQAKDASALASFFRFSSSLLITGSKSKGGNLNDTDVSMFISELGNH